MNVNESSSATSASSVATTIPTRRSGSGRITTARCGRILGEPSYSWGTYDNDPRMLCCLVLDQLNFDPLLGYSLLEGEVIQYPRDMFVQGREDRTTLQRIT